MKIGVVKYMVSTIPKIHRTPCRQMLGHLKTGIGIFFLVHIIGSNVALLASIEVSTSGRYIGDYGVLVVLGDNNPSYFLDDSANGEGNYRAQFYIRLNNLALNEGQIVDIFIGYNTSGDKQFTLQLIKSSGANKVRFFVFDDTGTPIQSSSDLEIPNGWHVIEIDWAAASGHGFLQVWMDEMTDIITGVDNGNGEINTIRWGSVSTLSTSPVGYFSMDQFESRRGSCRIKDTCFSGLEVKAAYSKWKVNYTILDFVLMQNAACH